MSCQAKIFKTEDAAVDCERPAEFFGKIRFADVKTMPDQQVCPAVLRQPTASLLDDIDERHVAPKKMPPQCAIIARYENKYNY